MLSADSLVSISALETMVATLPNPAHIKCSKTGNYLHSNCLNSKLFGMENPGDVIGLTVIDLMEHIGKGKLTFELLSNLVYGALGGAPVI